MKKKTYSQTTSSFEPNLRNLVDDLVDGKLTTKQFDRWLEKAKAEAPPTPLEGYEYSHATLEVEDQSGYDGFDYRIEFRHHYIETDEQVEAEKQRQLTKQKQATAKKIADLEKQIAQLKETL